MYQKLRKKKPFWRINEAIRSPEMRVIDEAGKQIGVIKLSEALSLAKKAETDLVEIAPMARPPVAKIINFGKFRYQEEKKLKAQLKKAKGGELKEIRFSPFIAEGDYQTRIRRMEEFLKDGNKVRVVVVFKGRHMGSKPFGYQLLGKILNNFGERVIKDMEPKFLGRHLVMIVSPLKNPAKPAVVHSEAGKDKEKIRKENKNEESKAKD